MKKIIFSIMILTLSGAELFAEIPVPFFGGNNFQVDVTTTFAADLNDGSSGLATEMGVGLWFEFTPYADRNITPQRDVLSVSLKLANSAFYAWRGYSVFPNSKVTANSMTPDDLTQPDQATSIWFDNFIAQLEYNQYWIRVAGIEPEISLSQASIKSVFDPVINNRAAIDKNRMPLPLFNTGSVHYSVPGGIVSVINRDLVHLNRREVVIAGNLSAGMKAETFDLALKAGSWKTGGDNDRNAWIGGLDFSWRPDLVQFINLSVLGAVNYDTVTMDVDDPMADSRALAENPLGFGLGYEYRIDMPGRMIMKPYIGADFIYETLAGEYDWELGGGLQWFFRGTGARFKRNTSIGGTRIGDVEIPAGFILGMNVDKNGIVNGIISINEDPHASIIPNLGGFLDVEWMNIGGREYTGPDGVVYGDFLWAGMAQVEYLVLEKIMPYVFARYIPGDLSGSTPVYGNGLITLTSKLGCRVTPIKYFSLDVWYERSDIRKNDEWKLDNGLVSFMVGISL